MTSRDEILQTFQTITGLEDIGTCMTVLEQYDWSLEAAITHFIPQEEVFSSNQPPPVTTKPNDIIMCDPIPPSSASVIRLNVMYRTMKHCIPLSVTSNLKELKRILEGLTNIECNNQRIIGLPTEVTDETQFNDRMYDKLNGTSLLILEPIIESVLVPIQESGRVLEPAPDPVINSLNEHKLEQSKEASLNRRLEGHGYNRMESSFSEGSGDDELGSQCDDNNDGFDEDMFCDSSADTYETRAPLIPEGCEDPTAALQFLSTHFTARYGDTHPLFYIGSLADALKEATGVPADQRKPMFIYLHHDQSILSNIFCSQLLCVESIVNYLSHHFVVWAWDLTKESLKRKLLDMVKDSFGTSIATHVDDIKPDHLPVILIVYKTKGQIEVRDIIQGITDPDKLLTTLISAHEQHQLLANDDKKDELEREERDEMIKAQEMAYQDSLQADKEKARLRQEEEDVRIQKEIEEQIDKDRREDERQRMLSAIPAEPEPSCTEKVSSIRMRFPDGSVDQRKFLASSHTVQMLLNYIGSKGYSLSEYKILTTYPKRNIIDLDLSQTLMEAKLYPTETLHIEDDS